MEFGQRNWLERLYARIASTRWAGWLILHLTTYLDPVLLRLTGGRFSLGSMMGTPAILLTTLGAKTGERRTVPLIYLRDGDAVVVIASATGIRRHPAWYHNLKKNPQVEVFGNGLKGQYQAREAEGDERERLWQRALQMYAGYAVYQQRAENRRIPVVVLEPIGAVR